MFGHGHYTRKGRSMLFLFATSYKSRFRNKKSGRFWHYLHNERSNIYDYQKAVSHFLLNCHEADIVYKDRSEMLTWNIELSLAKNWRIDFLLYCSSRNPFQNLWFFYRRRHILEILCVSFVESFNRSDQPEIAGYSFWHRSLHASGIELAGREGLRNHWL